jgi:ribosomal protein S18 acetylase RimI-like enzyme
MSTYLLTPASDADQEWLEQLRRAVYQELFQTTFGGWDEDRHLRHFKECWHQGSIFIIAVDGAPVGMVQLLNRLDAVEIGEIQIQPSHQNRGIGSHILRDTIARAHAMRKPVLLSVGLKNHHAFRLYERLGFRKLSTDDTHNHMVCAPNT